MWHAWAASKPRAEADDNTEQTEAPLSTRLPRSGVVTSPKSHQRRRVDLSPKVVAVLLDWRRCANSRPDLVLSVPLELERWRFLVEFDITRGLHGRLAGTCGESPLLWVISLADGLEVGPVQYSFGFATLLRM